MINVRALLITKERLEKQLKALDEEEQKIENEIPEQKLNQEMEQMKILDVPKIEN